MSWKHSYRRWRGKKIGNPESQILIDYFILDLKNKTIYEYKDKGGIFVEKDSFVDGFEDIEKMEIKKNPETKTRIITISIKDQKEPIIIEIDNDNQIVGYANNLITECGDNFLRYNKALKEISMRRLKKCGDNFLYSNQVLRKISMPKFRVGGSDFLHNCFKVRRSITLRDIVELDRKCETTTSEVNGIRGIIRSIVDKFRNRNTNRDSEEEK